MNKPNTAKAPGSHLPFANPTRARKATPSEAQSIRRKQKWTKLSQRVRREEPWCADPLGLHKRKNEWRPSKAVHHIIPIEQEPQHAHTRDNLAALCTSCHNQLEAKERSGEDTSGLFGVTRGGGQFTFPARAETPTRSQKKNKSDFKGIPPTHQDTKI